MEVDKWAAFPKKYLNLFCILLMNLKEILYPYGHMLVYIHWAKNVEEDDIGLLSSLKLVCMHLLMPVQLINHCVEFFNCSEIYYTIDKEEKIFLECN
jgi:hypothetical protein